MYIRCPNCDKVFLRDLYFKDGEDDVFCPKCRRTFDWRGNDTDPLNYKHNALRLKANCNHTDMNGMPAIYNSMNGRKCKICGKEITYDEYMFIINRVQYINRNSDNRKKESRGLL